MTQIELLNILIGVLIAMQLIVIVSAAFTFVRQRKVLKVKNDRIKALTDQLKAKHRPRGGVPREIIQSLNNLVSKMDDGVKLPPQSKKEDDWSQFEKDIIIEEEQ